MDHTLTYKEILEAFRSERTFLQKEFGVINIGIFGSYVKGIQQDDSDIDLFVEFEKPSFDWTAGLQIYLERKFNKKIELIRKGEKVNRRFAERIKGDVIYA